MVEQDTDNGADEVFDMSSDEFALWGDGHVAYIKSISGAQAAELFGIASEIEADQTLYVLHGADGSYMAISDSLEGLEANATERNLQTVSVH
jgi:hypothetical protein